MNAGPLRGQLPLLASLSSSARGADMPDTSLQGAGVGGRRVGQAFGREERRREALGLGPGVVLHSSRLTQARWCSFPRNLKAPIMGSLLQGAKRPQAGALGASGGHTGFGGFATCCYEFRVGGEEGPLCTADQHRLVGSVLNTHTAAI